MTNVTLTVGADSNSPSAAVSAPSTAAVAPAGWYTDPRGQARLRWWDGQTWTRRIADVHEPTVQEPAVQDAAVQEPAVQDAAVQDAPVQDAARQTPAINNTEASAATAAVPTPALAPIAEEPARAPAPFDWNLQAPAAHKVETTVAASRVTAAQLTAAQHTAAQVTTAQVTTAQVTTAQVTAASPLNTDETTLSRRQLRDRVGPLVSTDVQARTPETRSTANSTPTHAAVDDASKRQPWIGAPPPMVRASTRGF